MVDYKAFFETIIATGQYNVEDMEFKINKIWISGGLSNEDRDYLIGIVAENANNENQIDLYARVQNLEERVYMLENPLAQYQEWVSGYVTQKGEIVKFDRDNDGVFELYMYDGGRASTALSIGKIDGWYIVDENGNKTHSIIKQDGQFVVTAL